jgi:DNA-3-methyladenine glycosylase I
MSFVFIIVQTTAKKKFNFKKTNTMLKSRCPWAPLSDEKYVHYHDTEWGVPEFNDTTLFEMLILEGAQAGLSWRTVLHRRDHYRNDFCDFNPAKVAQLTEDDIENLVKNGGIIRNRLKIKSAITNARVFLEIQEKKGSFSEYYWNWVEGKPIVNHFKTMAEVPAKTALAEKISQDLKKMGMNFVGPTIIYSMMQATGMVNDHLVSCFRHGEICGKIGV